MKRIYIKVDGTFYVKAPADNGQDIQQTLDINKAKAFRSKKAVNRWLDDNVNMGLGLSWATHEIKLEIWS